MPNPTLCAQCRTKIQTVSNAIAIGNLILTSVYHNDSRYITYPDRELTVTLRRSRMSFVSLFYSYLPDVGYEPDTKLNKNML